MSTLIVNYNQLNDVTGTAKTLSRKLASRIDDYNGIQLKMRNISTNRSTIGQANYFIEKKNQQLQKKKDKVDQFVNRVRDFKEYVVETDKRVASRITRETNKFKNDNPISITDALLGWLGIKIEDFFRDIFGRDAVNWLKEKCRKVKYNFKDWYHEQGGKEVLEVITTAAIVIIIATGLIITGGIAAIFGVGLLIGLTTQGLTDLISGKMSTWEYYIGSSIGGALSAWVTSFGSPVLGGAIEDGVSTFITSILTNMTGRTNKSLIEISAMVMYSALTGSLISWGVGKVFNTSIVKKISSKFDNAVSKIWGNTSKNGILTGRGSFLHVYKTQMKKLVNGTTENISIKTVWKSVISNSLINTFEDLIQIKLEYFTIRFDNNKLITPLNNTDTSNKWQKVIFKQDINLNIDAVKNIKCMYKTAYSIGV